MVRLWRPDHNVDLPAESCILLAILPEIRVYAPRKFFSEWMDPDRPRFTKNPNSWLTEFINFTELRRLQACIKYMFYCIFKNVFEHENYIYGNMLSQDRGDRTLPLNAPLPQHPKSLRVQTLPSTYVTSYVADTTALTPDGDTVTMDGRYFNEPKPSCLGWSHPPSLPPSIPPSPPSLAPFLPPSLAQ